MTQLRTPRNDSDLAASPVDWVPIPLGPGQQPNAYGGAGSFQFTKEGDAYRGTDIRRNPGETFVFLSRPPSNP